MWRLKMFLMQIVRALRKRQDNKKAVRIARHWIALVNSVPNRQEKVLLHIGCGDIDATGYINIDARPQPHIHIVSKSLFRLTEIPDNVADMIYMCHVLEHVSHREIVPTLREMHRILKAGGVLGISVPDFEKVIEIYNASGRDIGSIQGPLMGGQDYAFNYHYTAFNESHLRRSLEKSGFSQSLTWDPFNCEHHDFDDWASRNISWEGREFPISLNIEAVK